MTSKAHRLAEAGMSRRVIPYVLCLVCVGTVPAGIAVGLPLLAQNWHDFSPKERYDALRNYRRHQQLPAERQRDIEKGYERWRRLPPDERARVRQNYERFKQMPPRERERFERKYEKWRRHAEPPT
jgi:hypothetical protein